jgi:hypothetical protein
MKKKNLIKKSISKNKKKAKKIKTVIFIVNCTVQFTVKD